MENIDQNRNFIDSVTKIEIFRNIRRPRKIFRKIFTIFEKFSKNIHNFRKTSIFWKISKNFFSQSLEIIWCGAKFLKNCDFVQNSGKFRLLSNFRIKFNYGQNFWKILIFMKISKNCHFNQISKKISTLDKISKNFDYGQIFLKILILS